MSQSATIFINRSAAEVYDYVMEVSHDAEWRTGIVQADYTSDGPVGVGTTGFDRIGGRGDGAVAAWTTIEHEPGLLARWRFDSGPLRGTGGYVCEQSGDGTRFTLEADVVSTGALRLLGPFFRVMLRRFLRTDVETLKDILENQA